MISDLWIRLRALLRRRTVERDLDDELRFHLEHEVNKLVQSGLSREEASKRARLALGGMDQVKEECRDARGVSIVEAWLQDIRQGLRGLSRNPGLSILSTAMLSVGMAAGIVVFSIFQSALLKPMPFRDVDRVVQLYETRKDRSINQAYFTEANFWDVRSQSRSFVELAASHSEEGNLTGDGPAEKVRAMAVTAGFFRTLGVTPLLGRDFSYEEERGGLNNRVALLGSRLWKSRYGGDPAIVGKTIRLNDKAFTIVGVLPPGEPWLNEQVYSPFGFRADANRTSWEYGVIGRLAPGVSSEAAALELQNIAANLAKSYPAEGKGIGFRIESSSAWVANDAQRRALWVLLGAVGFLMLIACMNLANLLMARGAARQREIAVRMALGAGRARLMRFVMIEALLLSGVGAALGLALAYTTLRGIQAMEIPGIPRLADAGLNLWVLGAGVLMALATGVLSGLAPAFQVPGGGASSALRTGDRQTNSRGQGRLRAALVMGEVALSFLLLVGAGLLIRSFTQLMSVNRGFQTENRLLFSVSMPEQYWEKGVGKQFLGRFFERVAALPETIAVGAVSHRPVEGGNPGMGIESSTGEQAASGRKAPWAGWRVITPGYFRAVGLPVLRGRSFDENDPSVWAEPGRPAPDRRVVISDRLAKLLFPNEDPIGKRVALWKESGNMDAEVIGVVGDSRERGLSANPTLTVYLPYGSTALPGEFVVHTRTNAMDLAPSIRAIVAELDPNLPVADIRSFEDIVRRSVAPQRFNVILLTVFSGVALLLATTGIYGVLSYTMSRRTSEIGLRMALGASRGSILGLTLRQGMTPALLGVGLGALGAWWLTGLLTTLLFGIKPFDLVTYAGTAALLLATALTACYLPGRRAMRIDPAITLRME